MTAEPHEAARLNTATTMLADTGEASVEVKVGRYKEQGK
jgi:hypothetical protein